LETTRAPSSLCATNVQRFDCVGRVHDLSNLWRVRKEWNHSRPVAPRDLDIIGNFASHFRLNSVRLCSAASQLPRIDRLQIAATSWRSFQEHSSTSASPDARCTTARRLWKHALIASGKPFNHHKAMRMSVTPGFQLSHYLQPELRLRLRNPQSQYFLYPVHPDAIAGRSLCSHVSAILTLNWICIQIHNDRPPQLTVRQSLPRPALHPLPSISRPPYFYV